MDRDAFLSLMIAHLEEIQVEEGKVEQIRQMNHNLISNILQKLTFDFPLLDDQQIRLLGEFFMLFGTPNYDDGENFKVTPKFLESISYIRSSPSYSDYKNCSLLFEGFYLYFPLSLLNYNKTRLLQLLDHPSDGDDVPWDVLSHQVFNLLDLSLPSIFASNRTHPLTDSTFYLILKILSNLVESFSPSNNFESTSSSSITSLDQYYSHSVRSAVSLTDPNIDMSSESHLILNRSINLFSSLLFLLRDLCLLKDEFSTRVFPLLFQQVFVPLLTIPSRQLQSIGYVVGAGVIFHLQLLTLFLLSDLCSHYLPNLSPTEKTYQGLNSLSIYIYIYSYVLTGTRRVLSSCVCENISTIVSCIEMISLSLSSEQQQPSVNGNGDPSSGKVSQQLLESFISIVSIIEVHLTQPSNPTALPPVPPVDMAEVFLSSRLFPLLSSLLLKPMPSDGSRPSYMALDEKIKSRSRSLSSSSLPLRRLLWILATVSHLSSDNSLPIFIHKIFLPLVLRYESSVPLGHLLTHDNTIPLLHLSPLLAILMGSILAQQNHTLLKSYEKLLTNSMKGFGDPLDSLSCNVPLTDIVHHLLRQQLLTQMLNKSIEIVSFTSMKTNQHTVVNISSVCSDNGDGDNNDDDGSVEVSNEDRQRQRKEKEFIVLLNQLCQFIELLSSSQQRTMTLSSLSSEYLELSSLVNSTLMNLTKQIVTSSHSPQLTNTVTVTVNEGNQLNPSSSHEMKRMIYHLTKLLKSHSNQMININSKTD
jgi:hypothetical protein